VTEFGGELSWTFVMGGLERSYGDVGAVALDWLESSSAARMPLDPLLWREAPIASSYPACMAVKAAFEQGDAVGAAYLRAVREGLMCFRAKLDTVDALSDVARRVGLDAGRFRIALEGSGAMEAFGADLELARDVPEEARAAGQVVTSGGKERVPFPTLVFTGEDGTRRGVYGVASWSDYSSAASAAGAVASGGTLGVAEALQRFGLLATREIEELCGLRGPRAEAELWRMATEFEAKPVRAGTGWLWSKPD
jgi:putative protein-disulfide isomerase